jgi:hypothetical protein
MPKPRALMLLVPAFALLAAQPVIAQDKGKAKSENYSQKVLLDNERVRVTETRFKPGGEGPNIERPYRVTRALTSGTLERTYADGKKEKREWKAGQVREQGPDKAFTPKNIGKSEVVLYTVTPKQPKK